MHSVPVGGTSGPFEITHDGPVYWRAAGYNRLRQRGNPFAGAGSLVVAARPARGPLAFPRPPLLFQPPLA